MSGITLRRLELWPGRLRSDDERVRSPFTAGWAATQSDLLSEVRHLGGTSVVIEVAAATRVDGSGFLANARLDHPGVVVSFESRHGSMRLHTDMHRNRPGYLPGWQANVRAVALGLRALRAVDRYGITSDGEQYRGWQEIGPGASSAPVDDVAGAAAFMAEHSGGIVLAADLVGDGDAVRYVFKVAAKRLHPDAGGDSDKYRRLVAARSLLLDHAARSTA